MRVDPTQPGVIEPWPWVCLQISFRRAGSSSKTMRCRGPRRPPNASAAVRHARAGAAASRSFSEAAAAAAAAGASKRGAQPPLSALCPSKQGRLCERCSGLRCLQDEAERAPAAGELLHKTPNPTSRVSSLPRTSPRPRSSPALESWATPCLPRCARDRSSLAHRQALSHPAEPVAPDQKQEEATPATRRRSEQTKRTKRAYARGRLTPKVSAGLQGCTRHT